MDLKNAVEEIREKAVSSAGALPDQISFLEAVFSVRSVSLWSNSNPAPFRMKRRSWLLIFAGAFAWGAGCRHVVVANGPPGAGSSSYRFLDPPPAPANREASSESEEHPLVQYIVPRPAGPLADPIYPRAALTARAPKVAVALRFTVDATGRVSEVRTSPIVFEMPSPLTAEFLAAAEEAVRQWRFTPGERVRVEWVQDAAGAYPNLLGREKIDWDFDVEFAFEKNGQVSTRRVP